MGDFMVQHENLFLNIWYCFMKLLRQSMETGIFIVKSGGCSLKILGVIIHFFEKSVKLLKKIG